MGTGRCVLPDCTGIAGVGLQDVRSTGELCISEEKSPQTFAPCRDKISDTGIGSNWQWEVAVRREKVLLREARNKCSAALKMVGFVNR